ncbi:MAG TPA: RES domain-containing protein [Mucilaginibacter sp.]|jgi:RES domain-containing protein|nr:RES domain-containing protein [Mucilaginibacter sp.]
MIVYRITLARYSGKLIASGRAARWNPNEVNMICTASSRSLACLENAVHRSQAGLSHLYNIMTIEVPEPIKSKMILLDDLTANWTDYDQMYITQSLGEKWVNENETAILQVPSSIISEEVNYLINPNHKDFEKIKVIKNQPFVFDKRIKQ